MSKYYISNYCSGIKKHLLLFVLCKYRFSTMTYFILLYTVNHAAGLVKLFCRPWCNINSCGDHHTGGAWACWPTIIFVIQHLWRCPTSITKRFHIKSNTISTSCTCIIGDPCPSSATSDEKTVTASCLTFEKGSAENSIKWHFEKCTSGYLGINKQVDWCPKVWKHTGPRWCVKWGLETF